MKVIWHSNAPWAGSGYGQQTDIFTRLMAEDGHNVKISAFYGLAGKPMRTHDNIEVLPRGLMQHGIDLINPHWAAHQPDVFVGLYDIWIYNKDDLATFPNAWWIPIDCDPIPPKVAEKLQYVKHPWAMSRFGERQMRSIGIEPRYVPHGIDTDVFKPDDREKAKRALNVPDDAFLFVTVAANKGYPSRKNLPQMIKAFGELLKKHPNTYFYLHTLSLSAHDGMDLKKVYQFYDVPEDRIIFPSDYELVQGHHTPEMLNVIYNAADAFILPSAGEGFGVPVIEAQAAGCPVIVSDFTAQAELCGSGMKIPISWDDVTIGLHYSEQATLLSPSKVLNAMREALEWKGNQGMRDKAREFAMQYDHRVVYDKYMKPALEAAAAWNNRHKRIQKNSADKYAELGNDYHWKGDWQNPNGHYRKWIDYQLSHLPEDGTGKTVLDFGCGDGYPASILAKRGYTVFGVENHDGARAVAEQKVPDGKFFADFKALRGAIYADNRPMVFDYVVALDVLEHVEDEKDIASLCTVIRHVKEYALVSTPPPGIDKHAVKGYTIQDINALFPDMQMDVIELNQVDQLVKLSKRSTTKTIPGEYTIAVLSDCRVPTKGDGAHGLGNSAYQLAAGLAKKGHRVTLYAGKGSSFAHGKCVTHTDEVKRAAELAKKPPAFDVYIDTSHHHLLSKLQPDWTVINRMGDGECDYSPPNMVMASKFLEQRYGKGRIVPAGIDLDVIPSSDPPSKSPPASHGETSPHVLFFGRVHQLKGVETAMEAARLANIPIKFVGPIQGDYPDIDSKELTGAAKWDAIQKAKCVILPGGEDFAPRAPLECAAAGVPVLTMPYDGTHEHVEDGVSGFICKDLMELASRINDVGQIDPKKAREWVATCHSMQVMVDGYEKAIEDVFLGVRW